MPIRIATVKKKIAANGRALHRAKERSSGADAGKAASEAEAALVEERRLLKEERENRKAQALLPRPTALDRLVRTHHPQAKDKPGKKEAHDAGEVKKPKSGKSRAEKQAQKAAALDAARKTPKKPAK